MNEILTMEITLRPSKEKHTVLAKKWEQSLVPYKYTNDKQASNKAAELQAAGIDAKVYTPFSSIVRYIKITPANVTQ